jgi:hypothetical protein
LIVKELKAEREWLRNDITRLKGLLSETKKYKKLSANIENKHFVAQKWHEKENWIAEGLISGV